MPDPIEHVVVLMLENQSFDRLVGRTPGIDGVDPANPRTNPDSSHGVSVSQRLSTQARMDYDPAHDYDDVIAQVNGRGLPCSGFVDNFLNNHPNGDPSEIMAYYDVDFLPAIDTLARSFVVCNRWFCSVPGPTWPNRFFVNSGTSLGHIDMPTMAHFNPAVHLYDQPTIFERLSEAGKSWHIYFEDFSQTVLMTRQAQYAVHYRYMSAFENDCGNALTFPQYAFLEPKFFWPKQNDQHPTSDIRRGDALIARVYNGLRSNPDLWNTTLFVILYDEHGGFYDHVDPRDPPYKAKAIPPDNNKTPENFGFDLFGPRVAAILVSPWLDSGVLQGIYDHTSLLRYLTVKWNLGALGNRVPAANNFGDELTWRNTLRTDVPMSFPVPIVPEDPKPTGLNAAQEALVAYSRYLESQMASNLPPGSQRDNFLRDVGQRLITAVEDIANHGPVAAERLRLYLNSKGAKLDPQIPPAT